MPSCWSRYRMTPGSSAPVRVPMTRPSTGVKPIVVATLRAASIAHRLAPLPRWATTSLPSAQSGATCGSCRSVAQRHSVLARLGAADQDAALVVDPDRLAAAERHFGDIDFVAAARQIGDDRLGHP